MNNLPPDEQLLADGLWYLGNMARTHECIAAVLARYHALEAEIDRLRAELAFDAQLAAADASAIAALQAEIERAQQFFDESYGGGDGTEPLIESIGLALHAAREAVKVPASYMWTDGPREIDARELPY